MDIFCLPFLYLLQHFFCPLIANSNAFEPCFQLRGKVFFLEIFLRTRSFLFSATIIAIYPAALATRKLRRDRRPTFAAVQKSGKWKIVALLALARFSTAQ